MVLHEPGQAVEAHDEQCGCIGVGVRQVGAQHRRRQKSFGGSARTRIDDVRPAFVQSRCCDREGSSDVQYGGELVCNLRVPDADPPLLTLGEVAAHGNVAAAVDHEVLRTMALEDLRCSFDGPALHQTRRFERSAVRRGDMDVEGSVGLELDQGAQVKHLMYERVQGFDPELAPCEAGDHRNVAVRAEQRIDIVEPVDCLVQGRCVEVVADVERHCGAHHLFDMKLSRRWSSNGSCSCQDVPVGRHATLTPADRAESIADWSDAA